MQRILFLLLKQTVPKHGLFPRERDLYIHESNSSVRTYENQAYIKYGSTFYNIFINQ